jgi:hypothetical protein
MTPFFHLLPPLFVPAAADEELWRVHCVW